MMADVSASKIDGYPEAESGFDYFSSAAHYQSVAGRILAALAGGGRFVVVTGSPPADGRLLANALGKAAAATHTVIGIPCGNGVTRDDWRRLVLTPSGEIETQEFSAGALLVALGTPLPLYVLEDADQLSDEQLREFFATWLFGEPTIGMAVLVVTPIFLGRLERPSLSFLIEGLAARILFQHLGPDEIAPFIRARFPGEAENLAPDAIAAIAAASGGDPALVNRLAFRSREPRKVSNSPLTPSMAAPATTEPASDPSTDAAKEPLSSETAKLGSSHQTAPEPSPDAKSPRRLGTVRRRVVIGGIFVVGYAGILLLLGTLIPRHFRSPDQPPVAIEAPVASTETKGAGTKGAELTPIVIQPAPSSENGEAIANARAGVAPEAAAPPPLPVAPATKAESQPAAAGPSHPEPSIVADRPGPTSPAAHEDRPSAVARDTSSADSASAAPAQTAALKPPAADQPAIPAEEIAALVARGDAFLETGDISSARLYYERAAAAGNGHAALLMAETFDPAFLERAGVRGVRADPSTAALWYRRARELGEPDAERGLQQLNFQK
jgi:hypothetical protein